MKSITYYFTVILLTCFSSTIFSQQTKNSNKIEELEKQKKNITIVEKEALKKEVEAINKKLEKKEITYKEAQEQKLEVAKKRALNIQNQITIIENQIELLKRNKNDENYFESLINKAIIDRVSKNINEEGEKIYFEKRTTHNLMYSVGFNNAFTKGESFDDTQYKVLGSRYFELGYLWTTRVFKETNFLRFRYGLSYHSNGLKLKGNNLFVQNGKVTTIEESTKKLNKSKLRLDHFVVPIFFEFGPSVVHTIKGKKYFSSKHMPKIGIGGYAGVRVKTVLKLIEDGDRRKVKSDFNTNSFTYGLAGYLGFGQGSIYVKYDVSTIFNDTFKEQNNISLGFRCDFKSTSHKSIKELEKIED